MRTILFVILMLMASCTTYKKCYEKFGSVTTDSVKVSVPVTVAIPRDSAVITFVTDTTYFLKEIQQGRARVSIERTSKSTKVQANCDTITITRTVVKNIAVPATKWVDPGKVAAWYRTAFYWILLLLISTFLIIYFYDKLRKSAR